MYVGREAFRTEFYLCDDSLEYGQDVAIFFASEI